MKKFLALLLVLLLTLSLVACGTAADETDTNATTTSTTGGSTTTTTGASFVKPENYAAVLQITINPQFRLYLDEVGAVLALEFANADAASLSDQLPLSDLQAENVNFAHAVQQIVTVSYEGGFVQADATVQLELVETRGYVADDLLQTAGQAVTNLSVSLNLSLNVQMIEQSASTASNTTTTTTKATTTTTTTKATTTTTAAAANKNPLTDLEYDLEYVGRYHENDTSLNATALQFEDGEDGVCIVVTERDFSLKKENPDQVSFEYNNKTWYSIGGGFSPYYYELTATEIIVKGSLWGDDPDAVNIRLVLQADGTLKVTEVSADMAEFYPVGEVYTILFR